MERADVVIGANYGDEGKGLMTDFLASLAPEKCLVIRFNGGAQAGHTVCTPDGRRHVFSHFGAASFLDCPSFLSRFFILNPMIYAKEYAELRTKGLSPLVYIDPLAIVSTPIDIFINQLVETRRGSMRHGSCGLGINETVSRNRSSDDFRSTLAEMQNKENAMAFLMKLCQSWLPARLEAHGISADTDEVYAFLDKSEQIMERYLQDLEFMTATSCSRSQIPSAQRIIFEGAQGLLLDEERMDKFPHLTRSRTGLTNVLELANEFQIEELQVYYMTRTYFTRHGAGPLRGESDFRFPDQTNIDNQFQGSLRFAAFDYDEFNQATALDLKQSGGSQVKITASAVFTCADQFELPCPDRIDLPVSFISTGPTRNDLKELKDKNEKLKVFSTVRA